MHRGLEEGLGGEVLGRAVGEIFGWKVLGRLGWGRWCEVRSGGRIGLRGFVGGGGDGELGWEDAADF